MGLQEVRSRDVYRMVNGRMLPPGFEILRLGLADGWNMLYLRYKGRTIVTEKKPEDGTLEKLYNLAVSLRD
ncbi:MAG: hypothetical protein HYW26_03635 [Candidatus Aenigmarchaeota archaeon]|nr:hypothetical protein [Candidatus Aenigmarchaeota archaeon]